MCFGRSAEEIICGDTVEDGNAGIVTLDSGATFVVRLLPVVLMLFIFIVHRCSTQKLLSEGCHFPVFCSVCYGVVIFSYYFSFQIDSYIIS
jgi:hypothetical protein